MRKKLTALLVGAALMLAAGSAWAIPVYSLPVGAGTSALWLSSGGTDVVVYDTDNDGVIIFSGSVGAQIVDVTIGKTKPNAGSATSPSMFLNNTIVSGIGTLNVSFTDLGFGPLAAGIGGFTLHGGGTLTNATASISSLLSLSNTPWAGSTLIDLGSFNTSSFSKDVSVTTGALTGPFSLTMNTEIVVDNNGTAQVTSSLQPVPEPGTMVLLGAGLLGLAVYGKRRMNKEA